jgi:hypothetical protein
MFWDPMKGVSNFGQELSEILAEFACEAHLKQLIGSVSDKYFINNLNYKVIIKLHRNKIQKSFVKTFSRTTSKFRIDVQAHFTRRELYFNPGYTR